MIERSGDRFRVLSSGARGAQGRHESLQVALDSSWQLLDPPLRSALCQCTVFRGGFDLDAAEAILDLDGFEVLRAVQELRDSSLLRASMGSRTRFDMLPTLREYAAHKAQGLVDLDALRARHGAYFSTRLAQRDPQSLGSANVDNLLAAHQWACGRDAALAIGLLRVAWNVGLLHTTAQDLYTPTLAVSRDVEEELCPSERALLDICRAALAYRRGHREEALDLAGVAEGRAREAGDVVLTTGTHRFQAGVLMDLGRPAEALAHLRAAIEAFTEIHDPSTEGTLRRTHARLLLELGRHEEAEEALDAADGVHTGDGLSSRRIRASLRLDQGRLAEALIGTQAIARRAVSRGQTMVAAQNAVETARVLAAMQRLGEATALLYDTRASWRGHQKMRTLLTCQLALLEALRGQLAAAEDLALESRALLQEAAYPGQQHILDLASVARAAARSAQIDAPEDAHVSLQEAMERLEAMPETWLGLRVYGRLVREQLENAASAVGLRPP